MDLRRSMDFFVYVVVRIFICLVQALPMDTVEGIARFLAWLAHRVLKIRSKVIEENLCQAFPALSAEERRRLARRMWEHLFLLVGEVAHTPRKIHQTNWRDYIQLGNKEVLVRLLLSDRPVIIVTAHFGNFEVAGVMLGLLGFPTYTVARTLDNPYLDRFVNRFRGLSGQFMIPKKGGYDQIVQVMSAGGAMTFLADQHAGDKGCWVDFFGRPASAHKAIALLAMTYNAPMVVGYCRRRDQPLRFEMRVHAVADPQQARSETASVHQLTQWYTQRLEEIIRCWPEQYWWLHQRWRTPPPSIRRRLKTKAA